MKIVFILGWYFPAKVGGVARMAHNLAKELVVQGHDVTVWTTDYINGRTEPVEVMKERMAEIDGVKVIYHRGYAHKIQAKTKQVISIEYIKKIISEDIDTFDIINLFESRALVTAIIMRLLMLKKKKNIFHFAYGALGKQDLNWKFKLYDKFVLKPFLNSCCKGFMAQTNHEIDIYKKFLYEDNFNKIKLLTLATNVQDNNLINNCEKNNNLKEILKLDKETILYLYLGRLTVNKGIERLIDSFALSLKEDKNSYLAIVGYDEGMKNKLSNQISLLNINNNCSIIKEVHDYERFCYYKSADVFIITSTYFEETSLASVEALSVLTPVIVTPEVELPYIDDYGAGITANSSVEDIKKSILKIKNNLTIYKQSAKRLSNEIYDISKVVKKLLHYYKG